MIPAPDRRQSVAQQPRAAPPSKLQADTELQRDLQMENIQAAMRREEEELEALERKARELDTSREDVRNFLRMFYANAADCQVDGQGRVLIPEHLRTGAGLEKEVYMSGFGPKFELWSRERWEQEVQPSQDRMVEIAENSGIGF